MMKLFSASLGLVSLVSAESIQLQPQLNGAIQSDATPMIPKVTVKLGKADKADKDEPEEDEPEQRESDVTPPPTPSPNDDPEADEPHPFKFFSFIGEEFFQDNLPNEASGLALCPDKSHLVGVSDDGQMFFLNLKDYTSGHCMLDLSDDDIIDGRDDFEGVAIDPGTWGPDEDGNMYAFVAHEGAEDDEPFLFKIKYTYDSYTGTCSASVVESESKSLHGAIPCLNDSNGIESLALKTASTSTEPAVFFVGIQDTGKVYEITSDGNSNGDYCYEGGLPGVNDFSSSSYDGKYLWSFHGVENKIVVIDPIRDCPLAIYDMKLQMEDKDKEGFAFDTENGLVYVAFDEGGDDNPSYVAVGNFTAPTGLKRSARGMVRCVPQHSCKGFSVCG